MYMYVQQAYFAKSQTTAQPQTARKFSDQGYETKWLKFQVSLPSILGPSMEPDSLSFPALITKPQSHLALSGYLVFCKISMWSRYVHEQYRSKVSWHSKLETRDSILASRSSNASSFEMWGSSLEFRWSRIEDRGSKKLGFPKERCCTVT